MDLGTLYINCSSPHQAVWRQIPGTLRGRLTLPLPHHGKALKPNLPCTLYVQRRHRNGRQIDAQTKFHRSCPPSNPPTTNAAKPLVKTTLAPNVPPPKSSLPRLRPIATSAAYGAGASGSSVTDGDGNPKLHVVFVHPQIHWNTGNIGRTCLGLGATLDLVQPLGFSLDERQIRRAGLDYWAHVRVEVHESWAGFAAGRMRELGGTRFFFTKFGDECATRVRWSRAGNVVLVFGSEVDGFDGIREWLEGEGRGERRVAFPMVDERFRSFNLRTTASMALWDAYKQLSVAEGGEGLAYGARVEVGEAGEAVWK